MREHRFQLNPKRDVPKASMSANALLDQADRGIYTCFLSDGF